MLLPLLGSLPAGLHAQSRVVGTVVDARTAEVIEGVRVVLEARAPGGGVLRLEAATGPDGGFILEGMEAGDVLLRLSHLAWAPVERTVRVAGGGRVTRVAVEMSREVVTLAPIAVQVDPRPTFGPLAAVFERMDHMERLGQGRFWDREAIASSGAHRLSSLLATMAGVRLVPGGAGVLLTSTPGTSAGALRCDPVVYLDGVRFRLDGPLDPVVPLEVVEVVEVYRRPSQIPAEYGGSDARCGVIAVWTRRG